MKIKTVKIIKQGMLMACFVLIQRDARGAGYEFEGVGARQVSRGGAAIADSDDWTSIYWNPGNIVRSAHRAGREVGVEIFGGEVFGHDSDSLSKLLGSLFEKDDMHSNFILGAIGAIFPLGEKGGLGMGFYTPLLQGADFKAVSAASPNTSLDLHNSATILTWTLSGSYEINPQFSFGVGANLLYGRLTSDIDIRNYSFSGDHLTNNLKGSGLNLEGIFGIRYDPLEKISLGVVYRTGSDVPIKGDASADYSFAPLSISVMDRSRFKYDLRHPPTWGIGSAYRPNSRVTWTLDYDRTLWNRFKSNVAYDNPGTFLPNAGNSFDWNDSWKLRFGAKVKLSDKNELIAGYAYEVPALDERSLDLSTTVDVYMNRVSAGWSHQWSPKIETTLGVLAAYGERAVGQINYRLSGYQVMLETRFTPTAGK